MFNPLKVNDRIIGQIYQKAECTFFFGNRLADLSLLKETFPQWEFLGLNQVHSSLWIEAQNSDNLSADAHFTSRKNKALLIRTADCMPILMRNGDRIAAVHAGWRGLIHNILLNSTPPFLTRECQVCVGPHIQLSSFEVGQEVADEIKAFGETLGLVKKDIMLPHQDSKKIWVSLASLARAQIESSGAQLMMMSTQDTLTSSDYFSYRRNSRETGRQISFVVRHC